MQMQVVPPLFLPCLPSLCRRVSSHHRLHSNSAAHCNCVEFTEEVHQQI